MAEAPRYRHHVSEATNTVYEIQSSTATQDKTSPTTAALTV